MRAHCPLPAYYILLSLACLLLCQPAQPSPRYWCTEHCALCTTTLPHTTHPPKRALSVARPSSAFFSHHTPLRPVFTPTPIHTQPPPSGSDVFALCVTPITNTSGGGFGYDHSLAAGDRETSGDPAGWLLEPTAESRDSGLETLYWTRASRNVLSGVCVYHGVPCPSSPIRAPPAPDGCAFGQELWSSIPRLIAEYHHSAW